MGARKTGNPFLRGSGKASNQDATYNTNIPFLKGRIEILTVQKALRLTMSWKILSAVLTLSALKEFQKLLPFLKLILVAEQFVVKEVGSLLQKS